MPETLSPVAPPARPTLAADIIIANAPDPVFVCDLEGKILEANDAVSRLLGLRRDEVLEQSISRFLGPDEAREFVVALREVVERDVTRNVRLQPRSAAMNSHVSSGEMMRDRDCSMSSSGRNPRRENTASLAWRILPSRSDTKTGSGAFLMRLSA